MKSFLSRSKWLVLISAGITFILPLSYPPNDLAAVQGSSLPVNLRRYVDKHYAWKGNFHVHYDVSTRYHRILEDHDCSVKLDHFEVNGDGKYAAELAGSCTFPGPSVTRLAPSETYDSVITFRDQSAQFDESGDIDSTSDGFVLNVRPNFSHVMYDLKLTGTQFQGTGNDSQEFDESLIKDLIFQPSGDMLVVNFTDQVDDAPIDFFDHSGGPEVEQGASGTRTVVGQFQRIGASGNCGNADSNPKSSKGWLALLLAYLGMILSGAIMNPDASKFVSGAGGLAGLTEALKGIGLGGVATQGRIAGFAGAALAEGVEIARIYQASTAAGDNASETMSKIGVSLAADIAGFIAGVEIMAAATGVVITASCTIGTLGGIAVGLGGGAVLAYGLSKLLDMIKSAANQMIDNLFGDNGGSDDNNSNEDGD